MDCLKITMRQSFWQKKILRRFGYSIEKVNRTEGGTPVFWLICHAFMRYMSIVFWTGLTANRFYFRSKDITSVLPILSNSTKTWLLTPSTNQDTKMATRVLLMILGKSVLDARDEKIISHLSDAQPYMGEYPCLIIYPEKQASDDLEVTRFNHEESLLQKARKI